MPKGYVKNILVVRLVRHRAVLFFKGGQTEI
jgi:hypothetical protein